MKFWLGVTDNNWFSFQESNRFDELNFWQPSGTPPFKNADQGMPFLFKLKRPNNHIVGGGFFVTYSSLPLSLAWEAFGQKNGAATLRDLKSLINPKAKSGTRDPVIGCTIVADPFFFRREDWIPTPDSFATNIVRGKMYDTSNLDGDSLWVMVQERMSRSVGESLYVPGVEDVAAKYGTERLVKPRIGQGSFRLLVTDAYNRKCAITGESTLPVLEAAHIVPYAEEGNHDVTNGLLLRSDFHKLFDTGLVSITQDLKIKVSPQIRETYFNGKAYYRLQDSELASIPDNPLLMPNRDALKDHYENRFIRD